MELKHILEPWENGAAKFKAEDTDILLDYGHYKAHICRILSIGENDKKLAASIVACVNACAGMAYPAAEIAKLRADKARLTEALQALYLKRHNSHTMALSLLIEMGGK